MRTLMVDNNSGVRSVFGGAGVSLPVVGRKAAPVPSYLAEVVQRLSSHYYKSQVGWLHETINPLWNMSSRYAQMIYDYARSGNYAQLEYLYNEIENCDPTFSVCVSRRCSALSELDWQVVRSDERLTRGADEALVKEQIEFLETAIAKIDNLPEALEHFALAAFRGFSVASIWRGDDNMPYHLECLDHWNICQDKRNNAWLWNKDAVSFMNPSIANKNLTLIPAEDMVVVTRKRQIDWPAMKIFLRCSIGERDWGRFLETYGLPPVIITMPELTSDNDKKAYIDAAAAVFEGRSGVVPHGSEVNYASESRGTDPFSAFIEHQMKLFVLMATGGTLTSLSEAGSGTLAGNAQMETWRQIVRADIRIISNAFNVQLCRRLVENCRDFKGKPVLAEFKLDPAPQLTPDAILELAGKAVSAGFEMDATELSQVTGFTIKKKVEGGFGLNAKEPPKTPAVASVAEPKPALPPVLPTLRNPAPAPDAGVVADNAAEIPADEVSPQAEDVGVRLVESLQDDFKGVADEIAKVLSLPEAERAGAATELLKRVDQLVPDDPAMAEVIAEQMKKAFDQQLAKEPKGGAPAANKAIPN